MFDNFGANNLTVFSVRFSNDVTGSIITLSTVYSVAILAKSPSGTTISGLAYGKSAYVDFGSGYSIMSINEIVIIRIH